MFQGKLNYKLSLGGLLSSLELIQCRNRNSVVRYIWGGRRHFYRLQDELLSIFSSPPPAWLSICENLCKVQHGYFGHSILLCKIVGKC